MYVPVHHTFCWWCTLVNVNCAHCMVYTYIVYWLIYKCSTSMCVSKKSFQSKDLAKYEIEADRWCIFQKEMTLQWPECTIIVQLSQFNANTPVC